MLLTNVNDQLQPQGGRIAHVVRPKARSQFARLSFVAVLSSECQLDSEN